MATSNYKVLTDVDLSNNKLYNTLCIANTEKDSESLLADPDGGNKPLIQTSGGSKSLLIRTDGDTVLAASNLTGKIINGKTSLKTGTSEVTVTGKATETITNSKTTIVATTTEETIDSTGINVKTPSQTVVASVGSKTISPSVTLATGPLSNTDESERASITLTKVVANGEGPKVVTSAKTVAVDATDTITQTAPTSTYQTDETGSNRLKLTSGSAEIKSGTEVITLTKDTSTRIGSSSLTVDADSVAVTGNETTSIEASNSVSVDIGPKSNPSTTIDATTTEITLASKKASLTASVTESETKKSSSIILAPAEETSLAIITDKNLEINSVSGDVSVTSTTLNSNATILANKDLTVAGTATFNGGAVISKGASVDTLNLNGVTIKWDSTLGALTFSKG